MPRKYASNPLWNHYKCADGEWIALAMIQGDRYWAQLCGVLGISDAATDERFAGMINRMMNAGDCVALLDATFATKARAEWLDVLRKGGDFIVSVVNSVDQLPDDVQVQANQYVTTYEHPTFGPTKVVGLPVGLSETPGSLRRPAPEFGQHTEEILTELLGYSWEDVGRLREGEVI